MRLFEEIVQMLLEDKESDNRKKGRKYSENRGFTPEQAWKIDNKIPLQFGDVARANHCKFYLGLTRIYLGGQGEIGILDENLDLYYVDQRKLNKFKIALQIIADGYAEEYDRDLNGLTANEIINAHINAINDVISNAKNTTQQIDKTNKTFEGESDYDIVRIPDSETAQQYAKAPMTSWCIAQDGWGQRMYDHYTEGGNGIFYFCLKHGYENITRENSSLEDYQYSMIAVCINDGPNNEPIPTQIVLRTNGPGLMISVEELESLIQRDFYTTFLPRKEHKNIQQMLLDGDPLEEIFDRVEPISNDVAIIVKDKKYNLINTERRIIILNEWAKSITQDKYGFLIVSVFKDNIDEYFLINKDGGKIIKDEVFKSIEPLDEKYQKNGYMVENFRGLKNMIVFENGEIHLFLDEWVSKIQAAPSFTRFGFYLVIGARIYGERATNVYNLAYINDDEMSSAGEFLFDWQPISLGSQRFNNILPVYADSSFFFYNLQTKELLIDEEFSEIIRSFDSSHTAIVKKSDGQEIKIDEQGNVL